MRPVALAKRRLNSTAGVGSSVRSLTVELVFGHDLQPAVHLIERFSWKEAAGENTVDMVYSADE